MTSDFLRLISYNAWLSDLFHNPVFVCDDGAHWNVQIHKCFNASFSFPNPLDLWWSARWKIFLYSIVEWIRVGTYCQAYSVPYVCFFPVFNRSWSLWVLRFRPAVAGDVLDTTSGDTIAFGDPLRLTRYLVKVSLLLGYRLLWRRGCFKINCVL